MKQAAAYQVFAAAGAQRQRNFAGCNGQKMYLSAIFSREISQVEVRSDLFPAFS
jgi:hypothetical protein